jgi:hypothetical protein
MYGRKNGNWDAGTATWSRLRRNKGEEATGKRVTDPVACPGGRKSEVRAEASNG